MTLDGQPSPPPESRILPNPPEPATAMNTAARSPKSAALACRLAALALAAPLAVSCSSTASRFRAAEAAPPAAAPVAPAGQWVKVRSNPPTYYPRGVPADCATGFSDGEWVYTGDAAGSRFFIPFKLRPAARRNALLDEALAARDPAKVRRIAAEESARKLRTGAGAIVAASPLGLVMVPVLTTAGG